MSHRYWEWRQHNLTNPSMKPHPTTDYNPLARVPSDDTPRLKAWEKACRIAEWICSRHPEAKVLAFGSLVRPGAWNPRSDIDLAASGIPDPGYKFEMEIQDTFPTYKVQLIDKDRILRNDEDWNESEERDPEAKSFYADLVRSCIEIPSPFPTGEGPPEILEIPKRLASSLRRADAWLREIQKSADLSARESEKEKAHLLLDAARWESMRYRDNIERGLSRVLGYIDRLAFELDEGGERLRLYEVASQDVPGIRPAVIPKPVAAWHSKYVELEYTLMEEAEQKSMIDAHIHELPTIHEETKLAFDAFGDFLKNSQTIHQP